jgi:hypothetical protein
MFIEIKKTPIPPIVKAIKRIALGIEHRHITAEGYPH